MSTPESNSKRPYFRPTTAQQRRLLFESYEETGSVPQACATAHVGRGTFYYWWPRFKSGGYPALEQEQSRAPHKTRIPPLAEVIVQEVIAYKKAHPEAGYRTVTNGVRQAHDWQPVVGATKVRKILIEAGLVAQPGLAVAKSGAAVVVHAPQSEQTVNIDLCVVPLNHQADEQLSSTSLARAAQEDFSPSPANTGSQ
jgi:transposase